MKLLVFKEPHDLMPPGNHQTEVLLNMPMHISPNLPFQNITKEEGKKKLEHVCFCRDLPVAGRVLAGRREFASRLRGFPQHRRPTPSSSAG